jgi:hypothetical protein
MVVSQDISWRVIAHPSDCELIWAVLFPANTFYNCDNFPRGIDSDLFMGGGSTVNVERSKASNTLTARSEP